MTPSHMDATTARRLLRDLGWSQAYAAQRLCVGHRTLKRHLRTGARLPLALGELLRRIAEEERYAKLVVRFTG